MHWIPDSALAPTLFPSELSTTESSAFICQLFTPESGNQIGFCLLHWPLALEQPPWRYSCFCSVLPQPVLPAARRGIYLKCITGCLWFPDWNSLHFFFLHSCVTYLWEKRDFVSLFSSKVFHRAFAQYSAHGNNPTAAQKPNQKINTILCHAILWVWCIPLG